MLYISIYLMVGLVISGILYKKFVELLENGSDNQDLEELHQKLEIFTNIISKEMVKFTFIVISTIFWFPIISKLALEKVNK